MQRWSRRQVATVAGLTLVTLLTGCSSVQSEIEAPVKVIPETDVVVETNVQSALQGAQTSLEVDGSFSGFGSGAASGSNVTTGPSTGPSVISYAPTTGGGGIVMVGWNGVDRHCIGALYVHATLPASILGQSAPGQYDFIAPANTSADCTASTFTETSSAPSGWPVDPSSSGWPVG